MVGCKDDIVSLEGPRFCRCKINPSHVREYFIYRVDAFPRWFMEWSKLNENVCCVIRHSPCENFYISEELFREDLEDCMSDGTVSMLEGSGNKISVSTDGEIYLDPKASFKFSVGNAFYKEDKTGVPFEFFIYDSMSKWYPEWFDINKMSFPLPDNGDFLINNNGPGLFDKGSFYNLFEVVEPSLLVAFDEEVSTSASDDSFVGDTLDHVVKRDESGTILIKNLFTHKENMEVVSKFAACIDLDGKISPVSEGRICVQKSNEFIFNFFVYGVDNYPSWYDDRNMFKEYLKEGDWVVRDFRCNGMVFTNYACPNMVAGVFEEIQNPELYERSVIISREQFDDRMKEYSLLRDIESVYSWFNSLPPEVFRYVVLRDIDSNGMVNLVKIYKSEISNK